jgi:hypothetical protein
MSGSGVQQFVRCTDWDWFCVVFWFCVGSGVQQFVRCTDWDWFCVVFWFCVGWGERFVPFFLVRFYHRLIGCPLFFVSVCCVFVLP